MSLWRCYWRFAVNARAVPGRAAQALGDFLSAAGPVRGAGRVRALAPAWIACCSSVINTGIRCGGELESSGYQRAHLLPRLLLGSASLLHSDLPLQPVLAHSTSLKQSLVFAAGVPRPAVHDAGARRPFTGRRCLHVRTGRRPSPPLRLPRVRMANSLPAPRSPRRGPLFRWASPIPPVPRWGYRLRSVSRGLRLLPWCAARTVSAWPRRHAASWQVLWTRALWPRRWAPWPCEALDAEPRDASLPR